ncbi:MAG: hypothetical protein HY680_08515 [Chloroflexi bacterium]|nr:hypothetical protein [Chloroflexota bacterium]
MRVAQSQRFSQSHPCQICGGYDQAPRGQGVRCVGFQSDDGQWAYCSREEHSGGLPQNGPLDTFSHKLQGECKCGQRHSAAPVPQKGHSKEHSEIVAVYDYETFEVVRFNPKGFAQRRKDGQWGLGDIQPHLYRRAELQAADPQELVLIVEGEKDVESARGLGYLATCNPMGAGKWRDTYSQDLGGRHILVVADADAPAARSGVGMSGAWRLWRIAS